MAVAETRRCGCVIAARMQHRDGLGKPQGAAWGSGEGRRRRMWLKPKAEEEERERVAEAEAEAAQIVQHVPTCKSRRHNAHGAQAPRVVH